MKTSYQNILSCLTAGALAFGLSACGEKEEESAAAKEVDPRIEAALLNTEPENPVSVMDLRQEVKPGEQVTVVGRIAGSKVPFSEGYATVVLADNKLETCDKIPGDMCKTPWDACCVPGQEIKAARLSIQVTGEDGKPVNQSLKGAGGLKELDEIVVTGTVAEDSTEENVIINASGIYKKES